jgi:hypothetical protein
MDLKAYSRLWDGSEPGWTVVRHIEDRERLSVIFAQEGATIADIKALRTVLPELKAKAASAALAELKGKPNYCLASSSPGPLGLFRKAVRPGDSGSSQARTER